MGVRTYGEEVAFAKENLVTVKVLEQAQVPQIDSERIAEAEKLPRNAAPCPVCIQLRISWSASRDRSLAALFDTQAVYVFMEPRSQIDS